MDILRSSSGQNYLVLGGLFAGFLTIMIPERVVILFSLYIDYQRLILKSLFILVFTLGTGWGDTVNSFTNNTESGQLYYTTPDEYIFYIHGLDKVYLYDIDITSSGISVLPGQKTTIFSSTGSLNYSCSSFNISTTLCNIRSKTKSKFDDINLNFFHLSEFQSQWVSCRLARKRVRKPVRKIREAPEESCLALERLFNITCRSDTPFDSHHIMIFPEAYFDDSKKISTTLSWTPPYVLPDIQIYNNDTKIYEPYIMTFCVTILANWLSSNPQKGREICDLPEPAYSYEIPAADFDCNSFTVKVQAESPIGRSPAALLHSGIVRYQDVGALTVTNGDENHLMLNLRGAINDLNTYVILDCEQVLFSQLSSEEVEVRDKHILIFPDNIALETRRFYNISFFYINSDLASVSPEIDSSQQRRSNCDMLTTIRSFNSSLLSNCTNITNFYIKPIPPTQSIIPTISPVISPTPKKNSANVPVNSITLQYLFSSALLLKWQWDLW